MICDTVSNPKIHYNSMYVYSVQCVVHKVLVVIISDPEWRCIICLCGIRTNDKAMCTKRYVHIHIGVRILGTLFIYIYVDNVCNTQYLEFRI